MIEAQGRHLGNAEFTAGEQPPMPTDHVAMAIDQHRDIETEHSDAFGDLPDLLLAVNPRVSRIGCELVDRPVDDRNRRPKADRLATRSTKVRHQRLQVLVGV